MPLIRCSVPAEEAIQRAGTAFWRRCSHAPLQPLDVTAFSSKHTKIRRVRFRMGQIRFRWKNCRDYSNNYSKSMRCCSSFLKVIACVMISFLALGATKDANPKAPKKETAKKRQSAAKQEKRTETGVSKMALPIPKGHDAKGLKIPYFDEVTGKLQMTFTIGVANRLDEDHVRMSALQVETFNADGEREMLIDLPTSILDLNTRVISTQERVTIKRSDFEITGQSMEFNTETKQGKLAGNVRMLIYNLDEETGNEPEEAARE